ncbi:MAG: TIGR02466 family protein [Paracoccaceae bacterium]|nr:TIGR02466 family protein [Paracoccaceae bacterium]
MADTVKHEKLFATPLLRYAVPDHEALNASLIEEGAKLRAASPGVDKSNRNGWHSAGNIFAEEADCFATLGEIAREAVLDATRRIKAKADPATLRLKVSGWMNANPPGGFNAPHTHPGAHWSGVYYVSQPEVEVGNSGMIEFLDPRSDLPNWRLLGAPAFRAKKKLRPRPGELILFPSYLTHWVYPNEAGGERVSIAFNATFRKKRGN